MIQEIQKAASALGRRSAEVRIEKWGKAEFVRKMREWGKKGGRTRKLIQPDGGCR